MWIKMSYSIKEEQDKFIKVESIRRDCNQFVENTFNIPPPKGYFNRLVMSCLSSDATHLTFIPESWDDFVVEILEDVPTKVMYWNDVRHEFNKYQKNMEKFNIDVSDIDPTLSDEEFRAKFRSIVSHNVLILKEYYQNELSELQSIIFNSSNPREIKVNVYLPKAVEQFLKKSYIGNNFTNDVKCLALRYKTLETMNPLDSLQGKVSTDAYSLLPENTIEAFASPFNHQLMRYCSKFDIDELFGSIGSFFDMNFAYGEMVVANPPFINSVIRKLIYFIESRRDMKFICILPKWDDEEWFTSILTLSDEHKFITERHKYMIKNMNGEKVFYTHSLTAIFAIGCNIPKGFVEAFN